MVSHCSIQARRDLSLQPLGTARSLIMITRHEPSLSHLISLIPCVSSSPSSLCVTSCTVVLGFTSCSLPSHAFSLALTWSLTHGEQVVNGTLWVKPLQYAYQRRRRSMIHLLLEATRAARANESWDTLPDLDVVINCGDHPLVALPPPPPPTSTQNLSLGQRVEEPLPVLSIATAPGQPSAHSLPPMTLVHGRRVYTRMRPCILVRGRRVYTRTRP